MLHRLNVVNGLILIDRFDRRANRWRQFQRVRSGANNQIHRCSAPLRMWYVHLKRCLVLNPQVLYVSYHTYDFSWLSFEVDCDLLAEGIFLRPVTAGNYVIDDRDPGGLIAVTLSKVTTFRERNPYCVEVLRRYNAEFT